MAALLGKKAAKVSKAPDSHHSRESASEAVFPSLQSVLAKHIAAIEPLDPLYETTIDSKGKSKRVRASQP